ncbi:hypothetical protein VFPPC_17722 [Pochonia chlamydosporia 170]|uniref:Uncharacterized protein n=1 Tax=Pochonia chlamydosporia 170 TaxID=1380566 RepID=A0A219AR80_METCM|nr:hypothetical protein VFPPC_17722 [Pochonia chlamydosporia 170]OWT43102.1 hypothetical protein VFPPC_17722 [Pochonia chlamydosporia 170]
MNTCTFQSVLPHPSVSQAVESVAQNYVPTSIASFPSLEYRDATSSLNYLAKYQSGFKYARFCSEARVTYQIVNEASALWHDQTSRLRLFRPLLHCIYHVARYAS